MFRSFTLTQSLESFQTDRIGCNLDYNSIAIILGKILGKLRRLNVLSIHLPPEYCIPLATTLRQRDVMLSRVDAVALNNGYEFLIRHCPHVRTFRWTRHSLFRPKSPVVIPNLIYTSNITLDSGIGESPPPTLCYVALGSVNITLPLKGLKIKTV
jgi:hypothetical protein